MERLAHAGGQTVDLTSVRGLRGWIARFAQRVIERLARKATVVIEAGLPDVADAIDALPIMDVMVGRLAAPKEERSKAENDAFSLMQYQHGRRIKYMFRRGRRFGSAQGDVR